jgi:hypothetical protein
VNFIGYPFPYGAQGKILPTHQTFPQTCHFTLGLLYYKVEGRMARAAGDFSARFSFTAVLRFFVLRCTLLFLLNHFVAVASI